MRTDIRSLNTALTPSQRTYIERRVAFALGRQEPVLRALALRLEDVNGPRGGLDKVCRIQLTLTSGEQLQAEGRATQVEEAVDLALDRVSRGLSRQRERARGWGQIPDIRSQ